MFAPLKRAFQSSLIVLFVLALCGVGAAQARKTSKKTEPKKTETRGDEPGLIVHLECEVLKNGITPDSTENMFHGELVTGAGDNGQMPLIRAAYAQPGFYEARHVAGKIGKCLALDPSTPPHGVYVRIIGSASDPALLFRDRSFTLAVWADNPAHAGTIMAQANRNGSHGIGIWAGQFVMADKAASASVPFFPGGGPPQGQWHHLAATCDAKSKVMTAYVDGSPVGTAKMDNLNMQNVVYPDEEWLVGARYKGRASTVSKIDDVRIYDRALTPDQIRAVAAGK